MGWVKINFTVFRVLPGTDCIGQCQERKEEEEGMREGEMEGGEEEERKEEGRKEGVAVKMDSRTAHR